MWVILLDGSGSIYEAFSGVATAIGRHRTSEHATKIEDSKEWLLLHRLHRSDRDVSGIESGDGGFYRWNESVTGDDSYAVVNT
jgi:hypothetical protein